MSVEVYYFSGTGNSLAVARDIAGKINARLIPISSVIDKECITTDADVVGIVFPVYYVGLNHIPLIVRRFVEKLENIGNKYIFAVCTFGGGFGPTLKIMDGLVRSHGGKLSAGFGVNMPQNAFDKPLENKQKLFHAWKRKKLDQIAEYVNGRRSGRMETDGLFIKTVTTVLLAMMSLSFLRPAFVKSIYSAAGCQGDLDLPFAGVMPQIDRSYCADENCTGCGTCAKVCPVRNIKMFDGKPAWQHGCENCLACINWCPKKAIHGYGELPNLKRYHHPEVKLSDMLSGSETGIDRIIKHE